MFFTALQKALRQRVYMFQIAIPSSGQELLAGLQ
jgi:hypothetical protein